MHTSCPQDMLLSWTCKNVFDPKPCLFFPTILVSLIKETTSVHKFCFSGGFHYNICCHKPLGIHRSLSLCLSLSNSDEILSHYKAVSLCKRVVWQCQGLPSDERTGWCNTVQFWQEMWPCIPKPCRQQSSALHWCNYTSASPGESSPSAPYCSISSHRHASNHL